MATFWSDFSVNFLANFLADALLGIALFFIIQNPLEKRRAKRHLLDALGLLKTELTKNLKRTEKHLQALRSYEEHGTELAFPMRYTRGVWNALQESGFLRELDDPRLIFTLLPANEIIVVANRHMRELEKAVRERSGDIETCVRASKTDAQRLYDALAEPLQILSAMSLPDVGEEQLVDIGEE
jgi:hypothetical protein